MKIQNSVVSRLIAEQDSWGRSSKGSLRKSIRVRKNKKGGLKSPLVHKQKDVYSRRTKHQGGWAE